MDGRREGLVIGIFTAGVGGDDGGDEPGLIVRPASVEEPLRGAVGDAEHGGWQAHALGIGEIDGDDSLPGVGTQLVDDGREFRQRLREPGQVLRCDRENDSGIGAVLVQIPGVIPSLDGVDALAAQDAAAVRADEARRRFGEERG